MTPANLGAGVATFLVLFAVSNVYGCVLMVTAVATGRELWLAPRFSLGRFYLLMGWAPLTFVVLTLAIDPRYALLFALAGPAGILGELIVALVWRRFFDVPIWTYSYRAVLAGHTSTLNFLPWTIGALLLSTAGRMLGVFSRVDPLVAMAVSGIALLGGALLSMLLRGRTTARLGAFSSAAFAVFCLPIATTALALTAFVGPRVLLAMSVFAILGFVTEYAYGRVMSLFFERGLWTYNHWRIDEGHTSFVTLPLWALGGIYFNFIAMAAGLV